jgi:hypothetical protein
VIPANYFRPELNYQGQLQFGLNFYSYTTDIPQMIGYGVVQRNTTFALLPNGHPDFNLSGTAGKTYTIHRADRLTNLTCTVLSPVTMTASGIAVVKDADAALTFPAFYRAVSN